MMEVMLAEALGQYVAIWKVVLFLAFFGVWAWVGQWLDKDTQVVRTNQLLWNNGYLGAGALLVFLWFVLPAPFLVVFLLTVVVWLTLMITYVIHRNARVKPEEKILTADHIKSLMMREHKPKTAQSRLVFITANKNELPVPGRQEPEYEGYAFAEDFMYDLIYRRVSVAEVIPAGEEVQVRYVIDGVVGSAGERDREEAEQGIAYLKAVAGLEVSDRRRPQTGQFRTRTEDGRYQWRLRTAGSTRGEQMIVERIEEAQTLALDALGMNKDQLEQMREVLDERQGLVVVSGKTGTGVSTTLYSFVRNHDAFTQNINSVEKKTLMDLDNITQNIVDANAPEKESARALQSVMRKDPDVLMVGFLEGAEMARLATQTALDGKKVYVGMQASSTFEALEAWIKMVGKEDRVRESLLALTNQRLVRKLCPDCREAYAPDPKLVKKLNLPADKISQFYRPGETEYDKHGKPILCPTCQGTGYMGRTALYETLILTDALKELIKNKAPINTLRSQARKDRMLYLQEQALRKVIAGETSIQEVLRVTSEKQAAAKQKAK